MLQVYIKKSILSYFNTKYSPLNDTSHFSGQITSISNNQRLYTVVYILASAAHENRLREIELLRTTHSYDRRIVGEFRLWKSIGSCRRFICGLFGRRFPRGFKMFAHRQTSWNGLGDNIGPMAPCWDNLAGNAAWRVCVLCAYTTGGQWLIQSATILCL